MELGSDISGGLSYSPSSAYGSMSTTYNTMNVTPTVSQSIIPQSIASQSNMNVPQTVTRYNTLPQNDMGGTDDMKKYDSSSKYTSWSLNSFVIGLMLGLIIMFIIMWLTYTSRTFIFSLCPKSYPTCTYDQFVNDPGVALATGAQIHDILFIDNDENMHYRRERAAPDCIPKAVDTIVPITHPQYCQFYQEDGTPIEGRIYDPVGLYQIQIEDELLSVQASGSCKVSYAGNSGVQVGRGKPLLKWTPSIL